MEINQITHEILDSKKEKSIALLTPSYLKVTFPLSRERGVERAKRVRGESKYRNVAFFVLSWLIFASAKRKSDYSSILMWKVWRMALNDL